MTQILQICNFGGVAHVFWEAAVISSSYGSNLIHWCYSAAWLQQRVVGIQWSLRATEEQQGKKGISWGRIDDTTNEK